jgi:hypothetical protein
MWLWKSLRARRLAAVIGGLLGCALGGSARGQAVCDDQWPVVPYGVLLKDAKRDPAQTLRAPTPGQPFEPWDLPGDRYLFGDHALTYSVLGPYGDRKDAAAALEEVRAKYTHLITPSLPPSVFVPGAYLASASPRCTLKRDNKAVDVGHWVHEQDDRFFVGQFTPCARAQRAKTVTVLACDGNKQLVSDVVKADCDGGRITTCLHPLGKGVYLFSHRHSRQGGSEVKLRVWDTQRRRRLQSLDHSVEGGPEAELVSVEDTDGDEIPEIVYKVAGSGETTKVLRFSGGRFVAAKRP